MTQTLASRKDFTLETYKQVAWQGETVAFDESALKRIGACREAFDRLIEDPDITIYGVTSGYGQMAKVRLTPEQRKEHANRPPLTAMTSFGEPMPARVVRSTVSTISSPASLGTGSNRTSDGSAGSRSRTSAGALRSVPATDDTRCTRRPWAPSSAGGIVGVAAHASASKYASSVACTAS